jgi:hypothetical protein
MIKEQIIKKEQIVKRTNDWKDQMIKKRTNSEKKAHKWLRANELRNETNEQMKIEKNKWLSKWLKRQMIERTNDWRNSKLMKRSAND